MRFSVRTVTNFFANLRPLQEEFGVRLKNPSGMN
jgi:hypothetical protein